MTGVVLNRDMIVPGHLASGGSRFVVRETRLKIARNANAVVCLSLRGVGWHLPCYVNKVRGASGLKTAGPEEIAECP